MNDGSSQLPLQRLTKQGSSIQKETVVEELAIQLTALDKTGEVYCHTTLLATPTDLIELHMGHLYAEGYVDEVPLVDHFDHSFELENNSSQETQSFTYRGKDIIEGQNYYVRIHPLVV